PCAPRRAPTGRVGRPPADGSADALLGDQRLPVLRREGRRALEPPRRPRPHGAARSASACGSTRMRRLPVKKTYKLYIGGAFPRSESGRTYEAEGQNVARASRKDVRDAVRIARAAQPKWAGMTAYNRGQVLYRVAEMLEARTREFAELTGNEAEVHAAVDRFVWYA